MTNQYITRDELMQKTGLSYPELVKKLESEQIAGLRNPSHHGRFEYYVDSLQNSAYFSQFFNEDSDKSDDTEPDFNFMSSGNPDPQTVETFLERLDDQAFAVFMIVDHLKKLPKAERKLVYASAMKLAVSLNKNLYWLLSAAFSADMFKNLDRELLSKLLSAIAQQDADLTHAAQVTSHRKKTLKQLYLTEVSVALHQLKKAVAKSDEE